MQISLASNGSFLLTIEGQSLSHNVVIPCTWPGMIALRRVLQEHARQPEGKIGTPAAPTQAMIDEWLRLNPPPPVTENDDDIEIDI